MSDDCIICDVECFQNYFLIMMRRTRDEKIIYFEKFNDSQFNTDKLLKIINSYCLITFNGNRYDIVMISAALQGFSNSQLKKLSDFLIVGNDGKGNHPWLAKREFNIDDFKFNHVDLINLCPLKSSLKIYGARLHCETLWDLPLNPSAVVSNSDTATIRNYCANDLSVTELLYCNLKSQINLRVEMSGKYKIDLRSKSDAQIAESIINTELRNQYGIELQREELRLDKIYYKTPKNINFTTPVLKDLLRQYSSLPFCVTETGKVDFNFEIGEIDAIKSGKKKGQLPTSKTKLKIKIGETNYTCGVGGLHSCEKSIAHTSDDFILRDYDVASYYPSIILNNKLFPKKMGEPFLDVYKKIVAKRLKAKREGNTVVNESLKITINGSFGKFGDRWSTLFSPDLLVQVTITGQLSLLMLIEQLENCGASVVSANTDGVVVKIPRCLENKVKTVVDDWQFEMNFILESADYQSLYSRDVNNYIAFKNNQTKSKGAFSNQSDDFYKLRSNPNSEICKDAVKNFLGLQIPIEKTIFDCDDVRKFITVRKVTGGAVKDGKFLGKAIRWYYGKHELDAIYYEKNGNKVPKSDGAVPLMVLPNSLPSDIDYQYYINESKKILKNVGYK